MIGLHSDRVSLTNIALCVISLSIVVYRWEEGAIRGVNNDTDLLSVYRISGRISG